MVIDYLFLIDGGLGKSVMATAVIAEIKKQTNKSIGVVSTWPDVFINNPDIDLVLPYGVPYIKQLTIKDSGRVLKFEPYHHTNYFSQDKHLVRCWLDGLGFDSDIEDQCLLPKIYWNIAEQINLSSIYNSLDLANTTVVNTTGGPIDLNERYCWARDMLPGFASAVMNHEINQGRKVLHIKRNTEPRVDNQNIFYIDKLSTRGFLFMGLVDMKSYLIDSALLHTTAAQHYVDGELIETKNQSDVVWIGTSPNTFGYNKENMANHIVLDNAHINQIDLVARLSNNDIEAPRGLGKSFEKLWVKLSQTSQVQT